MGDDGQLFAMTTQLMGQGKVNLLGLTVVTGNDWLLQEESDALKAVERMGVQNVVGVYGGADYPLQYDVASIRAQQAANPQGYFGAWSRPEPTSQSQLVAPPDGFAVSTKLQAQSAADFMIQTIKRYPNQVTILEVGPPTNLATAIMKAPEDRAADQTDRLPWAALRWRCRAMRMRWENSTGGLIRLPCARFFKPRFLRPSFHSTSRIRCRSRRASSIRSWLA